MRKISFLILIGLIGYFLFLVSQQAYAQYKEREYYEKQTIKNIPTKEDTSISFIDYRGLPISIERLGEKIITSENLILKKGKEDIEIESNIIIPEVFEEGTITIPGYVEADIIIPDNTTSLYNDLKRWLVWNPYTKRIYERGIMFLQGHSGAVGSHNYLDKLALYYNEIDEMYAYISMEGNIYKYRLEKKEIVQPGENNLVEKNNHTLVLMTCYPRNTTEKRALFYFVLEDVYGWSI